MRNVLTLLFCLLCLAVNAQTTHKASKAEAAYYTKVMTALNQSLPEKYKNWGRDLMSEENGVRKEGDNVYDCTSGKDCDLFVAPCTYGCPFNDPARQKLEAEIDALKGNDDATMSKRDKLGYRLTSNYSLTIKLMANYSQSEVFDYCQPGGYQKLPPPPGWDAMYFGSMENCFSEEGYQQGDLVFLVIGQVPTIREKKVSDRYRGTLVMPLNPALTGKYKVQNIVMYIQGSKELVADFVKSMNTASLRALVDK